MIPNIPMTKQVVNTDGTMHDAWHQFFSQLITVLQNNFSQEGFSVPTQSNDNVSTLNNSKSNNKLLINKDANTLLVCLDGVFKTVQTS